MQVQAAIKSFVRYDDLSIESNGRIMLQRMAMKLSPRMLAGHGQTDNGTPNDRPDDQSVHC